MFTRGFQPKPSFAIRILQGVPPTSSKWRYNSTHKGYNPSYPSIFGHLQGPHVTSFITPLGPTLRFGGPHPIFAHSKRHASSSHLGQIQHHEIWQVQNKSLAKIDHGFVKLYSIKPTIKKHFTKQYKMLSQLCVQGFFVNVL